MDSKKILELAQMAGFNWPEISTTTIEERLERFAALIEAEVRGDAEPVAWIDSRHLDTISDFDAPVYAKGGFDFAQPLYTHPAPAVDAESVASVHIKDGCLIGSQRKSGVDIPDGQYALYPIGTYPTSAVVRQLVDALSGLIDFIEIDNLKIDQDALRIARAALAAAKEAGL